MSVYNEVRRLSSNGTINPWKKLKNIEELKVAIIFINSYQNKSFTLGEDPCNDGLLFSTKMIELGYKIFIYFDISSTMFKSIFRSSLSEKFKHLVIYFTGHGTYQHDYDNDEDDGRDEALVFHDADVIDDEIGWIIKNYNKTKKLTLISDCCHSGTIFDAPNVENIVTISAAYDNETAKQTFIDHKGNGLFTYYFCKYLDKCENNLEKLSKLINEKIHPYEQHCNYNHNDLSIFLI